METADEDGEETNSTVLDEPSELNSSSRSAPSGVFDIRNPDSAGSGGVQIYTPRDLVTLMMSGRTYSKWNGESDQ
jgi:hypothetical protein